MSGIVWFRKCLRVHDNAALLSVRKKIMEGRIQHLYPIFILDPWFVEHCKVSTNRFAFLLESLADLNRSLERLGSRLVVLRGTPETVFPTVFDQWNVEFLEFEHDTEDYSRIRDKKVADLATQAGVVIETHSGHTLHDLDATLASCAGNLPKSYRSFQTLMAKMKPPVQALVAPDDLPAFNGQAQLSSARMEGLDWFGKSAATAVVVKKQAGENIEEEVKQQQGEEMEEKEDVEVDVQTICTVPSLEAIGRDEKDHTTPFQGGESEALRRMEAFLSDTDRVVTFEKPKTSPNALSPSTTVLSPHLKFGCLSIRLFFHKLRAIEESRKKYSKPPCSLVGQCLWREFFYTVSAHTPNFHQMEGNPICKQIPWSPTGSPYEAKALAAWKEARTGFPFIDAIMTQLKTDGWIHHLARHSVACFLTRGDLWVSWEKGRDVFDELLLDADPALNSANWMWLSASAFFHQYHRVYGPVSFGKKTDPNGDYIRKWLPKLNKMPKKYIYEPWTAPLSIQQQSGCVIGKDYPKPLHDHKTAKKENIEKMAAAYAAGKAAGKTAGKSTKKRPANDRQGDGPKKKVKKTATAQKKAPTGSARDAAQRLFSRAKGKKKS